MSTFLSGIRTSLGSTQYAKDGEQKKEWASTRHEADNNNNNNNNTNIGLSFNRDDIVSSPPLSPDLSDEDDDDLREQVAVHSSARRGSKSSTQISSASPSTHMFGNDSDQSDRSHRASTPAPGSLDQHSGLPNHRKVPPRPLPDPKQRRASAQEKHLSPATLQKALTRVRADLVRRNTRVRQLEDAYEEKKQNDLLRQARQDWAIDAAERECEALKREVGRLRVELARRIAGGHDMNQGSLIGDIERIDHMSNMNDMEEGSIMELPSQRARDDYELGHDDEEMRDTAPALTTSVTRSFSDDRNGIERDLALITDALGTAKKEISDKNWKIWRLEQQVEELEMVGFRNERAIDEQRKTMRELKEKLDEKKLYGCMDHRTLGNDEKTEDGHRYDLLGEAIVAMKEDVEERRTRSVELCLSVRPCLHQTGLSAVQQGGTKGKLRLQRVSTRETRRRIGRG